MHDYVGYWLECRNRKCGFPIRVPYSPATVKKKNVLGPVAEAPFLFACPVCLQVKAYNKRDLQKVNFRTPDPYRTGKVVLYNVHLSCALPRCSGEAVVLTVAAANVSLATLLQLWKAWKVNYGCKNKHRLRTADPKTWWIEQAATLS